MSMQTVPLEGDPKLASVTGHGVVHWFEVACRMLFMTLACFSLALSTASVYLATVDYNNHYYKRVAAMMWGDNPPYMANDHPHYPADTLVSPTGPYPYTWEYAMFWAAVVLTALSGLALLLVYWRARSEIWFVVAYLFNAPFNYFVFLGNNFNNYRDERAHLAMIMFAFVVLASYTILRRSVGKLERPTVKQWFRGPWMQVAVIALKVLMLVYLTYNLVNFGWMNLFINPIDLLYDFLFVDY